MFQNNIEKLLERFDQERKFIMRHINDIRKGGPIVFLRKLWILLKLIFYPVLILPLIPVVLFVRLLRPFVLIRFRMLPSMRIGPFATNTEVYLCERDAGMHGQRVVDIFYHHPSVSNQQLKKMWDRTLYVCRFARHVDWLNRHLSGGKTHIVPWRDSGERDIYGLLSHTQPHLSFTIEEEKTGYEELRKIGIPYEARFVCFHSRDSVYLNEIFSEGKWDYHNYRDSDINYFIPAAEELARRGFYALRMGAKQNKPLITDNPRIIDYSTKFRADFLDIFCGAKCYFYLGDPSGINSISIIFRRPVVVTNMIPLEYVPSWLPYYLFIPKKLWVRKEHRFMTFREILECGAGRFVHTEKYELIGVGIVDNAPEEIAAVAIEMDERLKGTWHATEEDEELQQRFWSLFKSSELHGVFQARIGSDFLRQNQDLLE